MNSEAPRILVEGGPVHRRVNHILAALIGVVIGGLLGIGGTAFIALETSSHQKTEARQTCEIQNRGLKAQKHFVPIMRDINVFLQPVAGQPKAPEPYKHALGDIRVELPAWLALQKKQPVSRSC